MLWNWSGWSKGSSIQASSALRKVYWTAFHRELSETRYLTPLLALFQQLGETSVALATLVRALNSWSGSSHNDPTLRLLQYKHLCIMVVEIPHPSLCSHFHYHSVGFRHHLHGSRFWCPHSPTQGILCNSNTGTSLSHGLPVQLQC